MSRIIKNKKAYDSGDAEATINGIPVNITEVSYNTEQEHQKNYTLGNRPTSWSRGKIDDTGSVGLMMEDAIRLEDASDDGLLNIKPFDLNITFVNEFNKIVNDTITCKFMKTGREVTGDMGLSMVYDLFVLDIDYNNV